MSDLLGELLACLADGRGLVLSDVAHRLDVSEELLDQMLQDLARAGYLQILDLGCGSSHCAGCKQHSLCSLVHGGQIWTVTDKGRRAATRP